MVRGVLREAVSQRKCEERKWAGFTWRPRASLQGDDVDFKQHSSGVRGGISYIHIDLKK